MIYVSQKIRDQLDLELASYRNGEDKRAVMGRIIALLDPFTSAMSKMWKADAVINQEDIAQNMRMILMKIITDYDADISADSLVKIYSVSSKREMNRAEAEDTGVRVPLTSKQRKDEKGEEYLSGYSSFDEILSAAKRNGSRSEWKFRSAFGDYTTDAVSPETAYISHEALFALNKCIDALPLEENVAIKLKLHGCSVKKISKLTKLPLYTVYRRIHKAEGDLAKALNELGYDAGDFQ